MLGSISLIRFNKAVKILLSGTVAVVAFVAVDFGCLYGYYHV